MNHQRPLPLTCGCAAAKCPHDQFVCGRFQQHINNILYQALHPKEQTYYIWSGKIEHDQCVDQLPHTEALEQEFQRLGDECSKAVPTIP